MKIEDRIINCLLDTGASRSIISQDLYQATRSISTPVTGVTGSQLNVSGIIELYVEDFDSPQEFLVADIKSMKTNCILGIDFITSHEGIIDMKEKVLTMKHRRFEIITRHEEKIRDSPAPIYFCGTPHTIPPRHHSVVIGRIPRHISINTTGITIGDSNSPMVGGSTLVKVQANRKVPVLFVNTEDKEFTLRKNDFIGHFWTEVEEVCPIQLEKMEDPGNFDLKHLQPEIRQQLNKLLTKYSTIFAKDNQDIGNYKEPYEIKIEEGTKPIFQRPYRIPQALEPEVKKMIDDMIASDIIEPTKSAWNSPIVIIKKKGARGYRFCVDYRRVNQYLTPDNFPLPLIEESLDRLGNRKIFSSLDFNSAYWAINLTEESKPLTAFTADNNHFQFRRMPFGIKTAPNCFQKIMNSLFGGHHFCLVYLDDLLVMSESHEEHLEHLEKLFKIISNAGLKLHPGKCSFMKDEIRYLGYIISKEGLHVDPDKTETIRKYPMPTNAKEVKMFLGLASFYRKFIKNFSEKVAPLNKLTHKDVDFVISEEVERSFKNLKEDLISTPVLAFPDFTKQFIVSTDASAIALGAVLSQVINNEEHPIAYASRSLNATEAKRSACEIELMAVLFALKKFRPYVYGRHFVLYSDNKALTWLRNMKDPSSKLLRWSLKIADFDFEVKHRPGTQNKHCDALSRINIATSFNVDTKIVDPEDLKKEQELDNDFRHTIEKLRKGEQMAQFVFDEEGILRKKLVNGNLVTCIPKAHRNKILHFFHSTPTSGHTGFSRTLSRMKNRVFWPKLLRDVSYFVKQCDVCQRMKRDFSYKPAPLQTFPVPEQPFSRCGIDIIGPLPPSEGYHHILTTIDHFTKFAIVSPLVTQKAEEVGRSFVDNVASKFGCPKTLLSDKGLNFTSNLFRNICQTLNIDKITTTSYHPQCNGQTERLNGTLMGFLKPYVNRNQTDWTKYLSLVSFAYNSSKHRITQETPFTLLFGRDPPLLAEFDLKTSINYNEDFNYLEGLQQNLFYLHEKTKSLLNKANEVQEDYYNRRTKPVTLKEGQLVLLKNEVIPVGKSKKFVDKFLGPYRISKRFGETTFEIEELNEKKKKQRVHVNRLKKYFSKKEVRFNDEPTIIQVTDPEEPDTTFLNRHPDIIEDARPQVSSVGDIPTRILRRHGRIPNSQWVMDRPLEYIRR